MKKPIPPAVFIVSIVVVLLIGGFLFMRGASGPPEFAKTQPKAGVPDYLKSKMSPDMLKQLEAQGVNTAATSATPVGQPTTAPSSQ